MRDEKARARDRAAYRKFKEEHPEAARERLRKKNLQSKAYRKEYNKRNAERMRLRNKAYRDKNIDRALELSRKYYHENKGQIREKAAAYAKSWRENHPEEYKARNKKHNRLRYERNPYCGRIERHGISVQQIKDMVATQKNSCGICGKEFLNNFFHIDHCHKTGRVRGLLCRKCNVGIGFMEDDVSILQKAIKYVQSF
jgi:hypothetical protein